MNCLLGSCVLLIFGMFLCGRMEAAVITVTGNTTTGTISNINTGGTTIDYLIMSLDQTTTYTFDLLSRDVLSGDAAGGVSKLDTEIFLFEFDAAGDQGLLGALVGDNDDASPFPTVGAADGSTASQDSYLSLNLVPGDYVLAISDFAFNEAEARAGFTTGALLEGTFGDYQLTITPAPIPEPASALLFGLGIAGLTIPRRRR
ncbi:MAG: DVUA0089 family protein [Verrucomicrobiota bacterium]